LLKNFPVFSYISFVKEETPSKGLKILYITMLAQKIEYLLIIYRSTPQAISKVPEDMV